MKRSKTKANRITISKRDKRSKENRNEVNSEKARIKTLSNTVCDWSHKQKITGNSC